MLFIASKGMTLILLQVIFSHLLSSHVHFCTLEFVGKISSGGLSTLNLLPWMYLMLQSCVKAHSSITEEKEMTVEDIP